MNPFFCLPLAGLLTELPPGVFWAACAVISGMGGIAGFVAWRTWRTSRWLAATPLSSVQAMPEGLVALEGKASLPPGGSLRKAPLTGSPCCWYRCKVEEYVRISSSGDADRKWDWREVDGGECSYPFWLRDGSGEAVILPEGAEVFPTDRSQWTGSSRMPEDRNPPKESPGHRPMMQANASVMGKPVHRYRYTEERIYEGDPLFVLGWHQPGWDSDEIGEDQTGAEDEDEDEDDPDSLDGAGDESHDRNLLEGQPEAFPDFRDPQSGKPVGRAPHPQLPFLISARSRESTLALHEMGLKGAAFLALLALAGLVVLLMIRFG